MTLSKIVLTLLTLFAVQLCSGQDAKPKAQLLDQFESLKCEQWRSRLDNFFLELHDDPASTGYIVISATDKDFYQQGLLYEAIISGHITHRKFNGERIVFVHSKKEQTTVELWKASLNAEKPAVVQTPWPTTLPGSTKAFVLGEWFYGEGCNFFSPKVYAEYLMSNPGFRGHIVVYDDSPSERHKTGKNWVRILTKDFRVPRDRLKFFYFKNKDGHFSGAEFWLVPPNTK